MTNKRKVTLIVEDYESETETATRRTFCPRSLSELLRIILLPMSRSIIAFTASEIGDVRKDMINRDHPEFDTSKFKHEIFSGRCPDCGYFPGERDGQVKN